MNRLRSIVRPLGATALVFLAGCASHQAAPAAAEAAATLAPTQESAAPAEPASPAQVPETVAVDFYTMHQRLGSSGLPDGADMNAYDAFLCPRLSALIGAARQRQQAFIAAHPEDKPPLIDGDAFSSLVEGPDSFRASDTVLDGDHARVSLSMRQGQGDAATKWTDTVVLQRDDGAWCIADVEYQGNWAFAHQGRLSDALKAEF